MPLAQGLLSKLHGFLSKSALFSSFPLSLLLIGLEALLEQHFSCPCKVHQNRWLTAFIFIGPALLTFYLIYLYLRPFKHGWFHCPDPENDDTQKNWPKVLISCLIPPVMWIFLLFLDGEYFACGMTDWDGCYVFNKKINMAWCHPFPEGNNMLWCNTSSEDNEKMHRTLEYFQVSQCLGFCVISVFSVLGIVSVGIYDCCITGKCDCLPNLLLCCCGLRVKSVTVMKGADVTLCANTEIQTGDKIFWMFGDDDWPIAKNTEEEFGYSYFRFKDKVVLNSQTGNLTIKKIRTINTGKYKLKIIRDGKTSFKLFNVTVSALQVNESVVKGSSVTLNYDTEIQKEDVIQWMFGTEEKLIAEMTGKNRKRSADEFRDQMKLNPQTGSLIIQQTSPEHSGLYKLMITSSDYSTFRLFRLIVCDEEESVTVMEGADVTLFANTEIQTGDKIFWMFGDHNCTIAKNTEDKCEEEIAYCESDIFNVSFKDKVVLNSQTGDLTIKKIRTINTGKYILKIISDGKTTFKLFNVTVSGLSSASASPVASALPAEQEMAEEDGEGLSSASASPVASALPAEQEMAEEDGEEKRPFMDSTDNRGHGPESVEMKRIWMPEIEQERSSF